MLQLPPSSELGLLITALPGACALLLSHFADEAPPAFAGEASCCTDTTMIHHGPALLSASPSAFAKGPPPAVSLHPLVLFLAFPGLCCRATLQGGLAAERQGRAAAAGSTTTPAPAATWPCGLL